MKYEKLTYESREFSVWILVTQEGFEEKEARRVVVVSELKKVIGARTCKAVGHKIKVDTSFSPLRGYSEVSCARCGMMKRIDHY